MKLIDKDAVLAEIEKRIVEYKDMKIDSSYYEGMVASLEFFRDEFINSLGLKEVNLEKEIKEKYLGRRVYGGKDNMLVIQNEPEFTSLAKHFFELGLRASNPLTWEDMMLIHKYCKDAMNSNLNAWQTAEGQQKIYEDVLKRFKAQKGE